MKLLHRLFIRFQTFFLTLIPSETMSPTTRNQTVKGIKDLAILQGIDTSISERCSLARDHLPSVPRQGGVYRIYEGNQLRYIGVATTNLRKRLRRHLQRSEDPTWIEKRPLYRFIAERNPTFEYYLTPYPGWIEDHELTSYDQKEELFNKQLRGNRLD